MIPKSHYLRLPFTILLVAAAGVGLWWYRPWQPARSPILVAGDSLVVAASTDLESEAPAQIKVIPLAALGASPCDFLATGPGGGRQSFGTALMEDHPAAVVLAFSGNPGVSTHPCIGNPLDAYTLADLLAAYRPALTTMGEMATRLGARVYLSATPARNPSVPEGWNEGVQHGYNGDVALNAMLKTLAQEKGWTYDDDAARALSGTGQGWTLYLPCLPEDSACVDGRVQVRLGGSDAIHCDAPGTNGPGAPSAGSRRYAQGLISRPAADLHRGPVVVAQPPGC